CFRQQRARGVLPFSLFNPRRRESSSNAWINRGKSDAISCSSSIDCQFAIITLRLSVKALIYPVALCQPTADFTPLLMQ
ncbi:hypothetical protein ACT4UL_05775, partial [Bacillus sp. HC-TM]